MEELWVPVKDFERTYEISNLGRLRRIDTGKVRRVEPKPPHGYLQVQLYQGSKIEARVIHRLVLEAFVRPGLPDEEGRHADGNKSNCRLDNLSWGTSQQNKQDEVVSGRNSTARLTREQVIFLRNSDKREVNYKQLAQEWGVTTQTLRSARFGRTYSYIT